jgi:SH3-like domain-containing protein
LVKPISLYEDQSGSGAEALKLQKGKAVVIETYHPENNKYSVAYMDAKKGKLYAQIDADAVETITYSTWYRVKRANGQTGWVLGKFLKTN